jgi:sporulation protein YqfC
LGKKLKIERSEKSTKWNLFKMDSAILDNDLIKGPHIELFYNNQAVIEGCIGVYEYNDTYLKLRLSKGALILNGEAFDILTFEDKTITVKGKINSLEFCL